MGINNEAMDISIAKKSKFGSAAGMLGMYYSLVEGIPPEQACGKINAQTDFETVNELKRAGILEGWIERIQNMESKEAEIVLERNGRKIKYNRIRDPKELIAAEAGTAVDIVVGIGSVNELEAFEGMKEFDYELMCFFGVDYSVPIYVLLNKKTEKVNISRDGTVEKEMVPNTNAGICGRKFKNVNASRTDGLEVTAPAIIAEYIEYSNDFLEMYKESKESKKRNK